MAAFKYIQISNQKQTFLKYFFLFKQTGKKVCELVGHKRAITAAIVIKKYLDSINDFSDVVVTASSDEIIKV